MPEGLKSRAETGIIRGYEPIKNRYFTGENKPNIKN
jgi:hypothetical protein